MQKQKKIFTCVQRLFHIFTMIFFIIIKLDEGQLCNLLNYKYYCLKKVGCGRFIRMVFVAMFELSRLPLHP
jgi:hypothetical protein